MRESNFKFFDKILISLVKWFFIFGQYNYVRYLFLQIQDLLSLLITCPKLCQEFEGGNFVTQISGSQFSRIHYDQPNNKTIKYVREPIGFVNCTSNELQRSWEIAGIKIAEYLKQVESKIPKCTHQKDPHNYAHHPVHNVMFRKDYIPA